MLISLSNIVDNPQIISKNAVIRPFETSDIFKSIQIAKSDSAKSAILY